MIDALATILAPWFGNYLAHSTVLLGAVWLCEHTGLLHRSGSRELFWKTAFAGAVLTASLVTVAPEISLTARPDMDWSSPISMNAQPMDAATDSKTNAADTRSPVAVFETRGALAAARPTADATVARNFPVASVLLALWLTGAVLLLTRIAVTARLAARELADREPIANGTLHERLMRLHEREQAESGRCFRLPRLSIVDDLAGPVALPTGEICLPRWAVEQLNAQSLDAMLAHELAHVRRGDALLLFGVTVLDALLFFQPLNRIAHRRLAALAELHADAHAAQLTGDAHAVASALAECAQRLQARPPAMNTLKISAAMASRRSPLLERVERLLGGMNMQDQQSSGAARLSGFAALLAVLLLLPAFGTAVKADSDSSDGISLHIHSDDGSLSEMTFETGRPGYFLRVKVLGDVHFTPDERDIASLSDGGSLRIREKLDGVVHQLVVTGNDGELTREYSRDDEPAAFDAAARRWLAQVIPEVLRNSAIDADARIERLHATGGNKGVLEEMARIESDFALRTYADIFTSKHALDAAELQTLLGQLGGIGSDFELRQSLMNVLATQTLDAGNQTRLLQAAASIGSDFEAAELLIAATGKLDFSATTLQAWRAVAADIGSDFEQRRALSGALDRAALPRPWIEAVLAMATDGIGSDFEQRALLQAAAPRLDSDTQLHESYLDAVNSIGSDFEAREALLALVDNAALDADGYAALLRAVQDIGSDFECLQVLLAIAPKMPREDALLAHYRDIAEDLADHEQQQAERALR